MSNNRRSNRPRRPAPPAAARAPRAEILDAAPAPRRPAPAPRRRDDDAYEYADTSVHGEAYDEPAGDGAADAQEYEAGGHYVTADLCGEPVRIIPPGAWRQSWMRLLNAGAFDQFAEQVIHPDDIDLYEEIDPTNDEFGEFVAEAATRAGESLGKSRGPAPSRRSTRRR